MERNFDNIQFESLRRNVDPKYNAVHDELTDCYYQKIPFRNYGILDKETFDKLHGLIFLKRDVEFHQENKKQANSISEDEYNKVYDKDGEVVDTFSNINQKIIIELKKEGIDIEI